MTDQLEASASVEELQRQLAEAREHKAAIAEVLNVISRSPTDLQPVMETVVAFAARLCEAEMAQIATINDDEVTWVAGHGPAVDLGENRSFRIRDPRSTLVGRVWAERHPVQILDAAEDAEWMSRNRELQEKWGWRTVLGVPILREGELIGVIDLMRSDRVAFSEKQIDLVRTFADQAAIALENVRLFSETKEALEQQRAMSDVLAAIGRATDDVAPVFRTILEHAGRLCDADRATIVMREGDLLPIKGGWNIPEQAMEEYLRHPVGVDRTSAVGRAVLEARTLMWDDMTLDEELSEWAQKTRGLTGARSVMTVPLLRDSVAIGAINLRRTEVRPFTPRQAALVETFAEQATIAIENVRLFNETRESLERQTAIASILRAIPGSPTDVRPVLHTIAESAVRFCAAEDATVMLIRGDHLESVAHVGGVDTPLERPTIPREVSIAPTTVGGRAILERRVIQVDDAQAESQEYPETAERAREFGYWSIVAAPLLSERTPLGVIVLRRAEVRPFSPRQIDLLTTFADQAVIAIENVRLFNETKASLDRETALADVLRTIANSPNDLQPVLDTIARSAATFCRAENVMVALSISDDLQMRAHYGFADLSEAKRRANFWGPARVSGRPPKGSSVSGRAFLDRQVVHVPDALELDEAEFAVAVADARAYGDRALLAAPLLRQGESIGVILLRRTEPGAFTDEQVNLVKTFADQAVIAIENVRLFNETKEALEQRTAVADVLSVISRSPTDIQPVLDAVAGTAARLLRANDVVIVRREGDMIVGAAHVGDVPLRPDHGKPQPLDPGMVSHRAILEARPIHVPDLLSAASEFPTAAELARHSGQRTSLAVPLMREGVAIGSILLRRVEARPFTDPEVRLLETFADQAAIAIENVRLFNETKETLERQTAVGDVLKAISEAPTDARPVLDTVARNAARFCAAEDVTVALVSGEHLIIGAHTGPVPAPQRYWIPQSDWKVDRTTVSGRAIVDRQTVHVADIQVEDDEYPNGSRQARELGHHTTLATPLLREGRPLGSILLRRLEIEPFTDRQIGLVRTFADQAAIAIENVRLFNETKEALEQQRAIAEILEVISRSTTDIGPVFDVVANSAARLTRADGVAIFRAEGADLVAVAFAPEGYRPRHVSLGGPVPTNSVPGLAYREGRTVHIENASQHPEFPQGEPFTRLAVPIVTSSGVFGVLLVVHLDVRPFSPREIALLETFARQAAIAIDNVRLFNETNESLEQQRATAEVLEVISRSTTDLAPVFETIAQKALRLCEGDSASILYREGTAFRMVAHAGFSPAELAAVESAGPLLLRPGRGSLGGRVLLERRPVQIMDVKADTEYDLTQQYADPGALQLIDLPMSLLGVPMLRDDDVIGVIVIRRQRAGAFTVKQVALLETFAAQAMIAVENVRLFNETKEALEQQTASAEILRVIASSPTDVQPVLKAIAESAAALCAAEDAAIGLVEGSIWSIWAHHGPVELRPDSSSPIGDQFVSGHAMLERRTIRVDDLQSDAGRDRYPGGARVSPTTRAIMATPLLRQGSAIGAIFVRRNEAVAFTDRHAALIEAFASQAVIAIENVRLFNETKESLEQQTATADVLTAIAGSTSDLTPVFDVVVEQAARLCTARDAFVFRRDPDGFRLVASRGALYTEGERREHRTREAAPADSGGTFMGAVALEGRTMHYADVLAPPPHENFDTRLLANWNKEWGVRALLGVPMILKGQVVGVIGVSRPEPRPFSDGEIRLVETFAEQSAIAIENVRLFNETRESLERQTAIAGILRAISESPTDVQPVLDAIAESAARFCGAEDAAVILVDGDDLRTRAHRGPIELKTQLAMEFPLTRGTVTGRSIIDRQTVQVPDLLGESDEEYPIGKEQARRMGHRTTLATPLLREGAGIGAILLRRMEVRPFSEHQVELVRTFADQAVIAIENVRLFNETKEALERQTATAGILRAISESPTDVQPVLDSIAESAARFCDAHDTVIGLMDGPLFTIKAHHGPIATIPYGVPVDRSFVAGHAVLERRTIQVLDLQAEASRYPHGVAASPTTRTIVATPLLRSGEAIGTIILRRTDVQAFTDRQIELVETFAQQAVIAIENVRLFNETRESLDQQTAVAEILKTISRSAFDLRPVLETLVEQAARLCEADHGSVHRWDGRAYRTAAFWGPGLTDEYKATAYTTPRYPGRETLIGRTALTRDVVHIPDVLADPEYAPRDLQSLGGYRTVLGVPLLREGFPIGVFGLMRDDVRPFTERQIELVRTFADQAAIAIENVRLFNETKEALGQQTAIREILEATTRSAFNVGLVMQVIAERSAVLCEAEHAWVGRYTETTDVLLDAYWGPSEDVRAQVGTVRQLPWRKPGGASRVPRAIKVSAVGAAVLLLRDRDVLAAWSGTLNIDDASTDPELSQGEIRRLTGVRGWLQVPLAKDGELIGVINLGRSRPGKFNEDQVRLVETFASQAVIAIENVRLFNEIQDKSRQLEVASRHKSEFLANMSHELRTPLNAIIGFTDVMLQEMFGPLNEKQKEYLEDVRGSGDHLLTLINDILDLSKIEAGRLELELAEFSFPDALEHALTLVRERATRHGIRLAAEVAKGVGTISADERKVKQILVNLLSNAVKFTPEGGWVSVSAKRENGQLQVAVRDTGIGVAAEDQERIFEEFQQVGRDPEKSREGTGLGLTLAKRFVELHGGRIWVESEIGKGSTFTFAIPVRQTALAEAKG